MSKKSKEPTQVSRFVQGLLTLASNFESLGPRGKTFSDLCHTQIEILKLIKIGDLADLNSASEGLQVLINDLDQSIRKMDQVQSENEDSASLFDQLWIEIESISFFPRRLLIDLLICQAMVNIEWSEHPTASDFFQQAQKVS